MSSYMPSTYGVPLGPSSTPPGVRHLKTGVAPGRMPPVQPNGTLSPDVRRQMAIAKAQGQPINPALAAARAAYRPGVEPGLDAGMLAGQVGVDGFTAGTGRNDSNARNAMANMYAGHAQESLANIRAGRATPIDYQIAGLRDWDAEERREGRQDRNNFMNQFMQFSVQGEGTPQSKSRALGIVMNHYGIPIDTFAAPAAPVAGGAGSTGGSGGALAESDALADLFTPSIDESATKKAKTIEAENALKAMALGVSGAEVPVTTPFTGTQGLDEVTNISLNAIGEIAPDGSWAALKGQPGLYIVRQNNRFILSNTKTPAPGWKDARTFDNQPITSWTPYANYWYDTTLGIGSLWGGTRLSKQDNL